MTATYKFPFAMVPYTAANIPASYKPFRSAKYPNIPYNNVDAFPWVQYTFHFKATSAATKLTFQVCMSVFVMGRASEICGVGIPIVGPQWGEQFGSMGLLAWG
jgi:hypothetical protein